MMLSCDENAHSMTPNSRVVIKIMVMTLVMIMRGIANDHLSANALGKVCLVRLCLTANKKTMKIYHNVIEQPK